MSLLVAALGPAAAKDLFFTARRIGAAEAQRLGVVQRVIPDTELDREARFSRGRSPRTHP